MRRGTDRQAQTAVATTHFALLFLMRNTIKAAEADVDERDRRLFSPIEQDVDKINTPPIQ